MNFLIIFRILKNNVIKESFPKVLGRIGDDMASNRYLVRTADAT
jgi:hypothetical protein